jgi:hypothetical protein
LAGAGLDRWSLRPPSDPKPYHQRIREVARQVPDHVGDWVVTDHPDSSTQDYLGANVYLSRTFTNAVTHQQARLLIVQCFDARDLMPHYPAVCYPGTGLTQLAANSRTWSVAGLSIPGTEYEFETNDFRQAGSTIVDNFIILPDGTLAHSMEEARAKYSMKYRYFGMGQVQVVFGGGVPSDVREAVFREVVGAHKGLIDAIRGGVQQ